jgi:hypothetical protein
MSIEANNPKQSNKARGRSDAVQWLQPQWYCEQSYGVSGPPEECHLFPHVANCMDCPDPLKRFKVQKGKWLGKHLYGEVKMQRKRHCVLVDFIDDEGRIRKQKRFEIRAGMKVTKVVL